MALHRWCFYPPAKFILFLNRSILFKAKKHAYACLLCSKKVSGVECMEKHYKKIHSDIYKCEARIICKRCGNMFPQQSKGDHECPIPPLSKKDLNKYFVELRRNGGKSASQESDDSS